jgi:hypothetical protein
LHRQYWIAVALVLVILPIFVFPYSLGLITSLAELVTQIVAIAVGSLITAAAILFWKKPREEWRETSIAFTPRGFPAELVIEDILVKEIMEEETGIKQKRFAVRVVNKGSIDARESKATLTLRKGDDKISNEFRWLIWEGEPPPTRQTINANDKEYVFVVFSDSRFNCRALACKLNTMYKNKAASWLQQSKRVMMKDSFEEGDYEAMLEIKARDNISTSAKFKIHVGSNYDELTVERI